MSDTDFLSLANPGVQKLTPYAPGKPLEELEREYGITEAVKLASNENPLGPSPAAVAAVKKAAAELHRYPDGNSFELKAALAKKHVLDSSQITLGNGSNDVLELIARTFVMPGDEVLFSAHAFAVYPIVTQAVNGVMNIAPATSADSEQPYGHDLDAMAARINEKTRVIFVANPNNPTGTWVQRDALRQFVEQVPSRVIVVVDEAYFEFVEEADYPDATEWLSEFPNLIVTRTFSKLYGIPGVRIGYGLSHPDIADLLNRVRQPFNVNSLAQAAAVAALNDDDYLQKSLDNNRQGLQQIVQACKANGWGYIPSVGNFICVKVGEHADAVYEGLLKEGVIVRPIAGYQLPEYVRVTIGTPEENARFIQALETVLKSLD
ncbi:histidinol-phosphate aminotransferase [gamma proteobacterium HTCC5015]|nr:histidinol-phosphate aminotransferase [gamma proteobacterium HTCC5015]